MRIFLFLLLAASHHFASAAISPTILPNTKFCVHGSVAHTYRYCVDAIPCKVIDGHNVCLQNAPSPPANALITNFTCWSEADDYTCDVPDSNCEEYYSNAACTEIGTPFCTLDGNGMPMTAPSPKLGLCSSTTRTFQCYDNNVPPPTTTTTCATTDVMNGLDWSVASPSAGNDFIQAAAGQEFARQIVTYGYDGSGNLSNIFSGVPMTCRDGMVGLKNCCAHNIGGGIKSNADASTLMGNAIGAGLKYGAGYAAKVGSAYVYDLMLSDVAPQFMQSGIASTANAMQSNTWGSGFSMYGFAGNATAAGGMFGTTASVEIMGSGVWFNPYSFALALAIQVVINATNCSDEERSLANLKTNNLCIGVGSYCSNEIKVNVFGSWIVIGCEETTQTFCCFNGQLAKGINQAAHSFYGMSYGSPQSPNCSGLSISQIQGLDFSSPVIATALDPFKTEMQAKVNANAEARMANGSFSNDLQQNATQNLQALCLQRQLTIPATVCP